jgi:hypothetical protein
MVKNNFIINIIIHHIILYKNYIVIGFFVNFLDDLLDDFLIR